MSQPPRLAVRVLEWWLRGADRDEVLGDLDEQFSRVAAELDPRRARAWYWGQTLHLLGRFGPRQRVPHLSELDRRRLMLLDDLRHAARRVRVHPARSLITVAMLAVAVGVSTAAFAVLDSLVLERAPFREPGTLRTVRIRNTYGSDNPELIRLVKGWRDDGPFDRVEAAGEVAGPASATEERLPAAQVTAGLFDMLGMRPVRGRSFTDEDARGGAEPPVLISERVWRTRFGADSSVLGRPVRVNGQQYRLIGIMPADFRFPSWDTVVWLPLSLEVPSWPRTVYQAYVRLPDGMPEADVLARATAIAGAADPRFTARPNELAMWPTGGVLDEYASRAIPLFAGGIGLVFLALCANVGGLLLGQLTSRRREFALRGSLGASRARLLRQAALEHLVLGGAGVTAGVGLAWGLTSIAPSLLSEGFNLTQSLNLIDVDTRALLVTGALGLLVVGVCGVLPAWVGTRIEPTGSMRLAERTSTESRSARALGRTLLVAQIAFASMLLVGAALLLRSFERMATADRGMNPRGVHRMNAFMSSVAPYVLDDLQARFAAMPGIEGVTLAGSAPPSGNFTWMGEMRSDGVGRVEVPLNLYEVRPDFFGFYGITLDKGRLFHAGDDPTVAIVGERVASLLWPGADPVGRTFAMDMRQFVVVGVAKEIALPSLDDGVDLPELYVPFSGRRSVLAISWRCVGTCPDRQHVMARLNEVDPGAKAFAISSAENDYARQLVRPRAAAQVSTLFAGVAFLTFGAGLFAMLSYAVGRRRREFGIRTALGATPARLRRTVMVDAMTVTGLGLTVGATAAWWLQGVVASLVYGVSPRDPVAWSATIAIVALTMLLASWRPSRQAARVDPVQLLRED